MTTSSVPALVTASPALRPRGERGVVLFIALLVMVALSLAGIALIRSADTATIVAGNLSFKDLKLGDMLAQNYYACVQDDVGGCILPNNAIPEIPKVLKTRANFAGAGLNAGLVPDDAAGNKSFYVIERMCANAGPSVGSNCNLSSLGLGADAGTQHYEGLVRPGDAFYRVTVRVEGPRNTVAYAQAILQ